MYQGLACTSTFQTIGAGEILKEYSQVESIQPNIKMTVSFLSQIVYIIFKFHTYVRFLIFPDLFPLTKLKKSYKRELLITNFFFFLQKCFGKIGSLCAQEPAHINNNELICIEIGSLLC